MVRGCWSVEVLLAVMVDFSYMRRVAVCFIRLSLLGCGSRNMICSWGFMKMEFDRMFFNHENSRCTDEMGTAFRFQNEDELDGYVYI